MTSALPTGLRIRGRIAAAHGDDDVVFVRATMRDPAGVSHRLAGPPAVIRTDAGARIALEWPPANDLVAVPTTKVAGSFREVSQHELAMPWRERQRRLGARVEIEGLVLKSGDLVEVYGEPSDRSFAEHGASPRDAPSSTLTSVHVHIVAGGKSPRAAMDDALGAMFPALARPVRTRVATPGALVGGSVLAVLALAAALAGIALGPFALAIDGAIGAIGFLGLAWLVLQSPRYPQFLRGAENTRSSADVAIITVGISALVAHAGMTVSILYTDAIRTSETGARAFTGIVVCSLFALAITRAFAGLKSVDVASGIVKAAAIPPSITSDTIGSIVGVVRDPSPVKLRDMTVALAREHDIEVVGGSDPNIVRTTVHNRDTFLVETGDAIYEVDPAQALWASAIVTNTKTAKGRFEREVVPIGARIVICGSARLVAAGVPARIEAAHGDQPVRFYVTRSDGDPRGELERMCRAHWRCAVGIALMALAALFVGVTANARLPPEHHSDGD